MLALATPENVVRVEVLGPHFTKFHLNNGQVLHLLTMADTGLPHNHPWGFLSHVLRGYRERVFTPHADGTWSEEVIDRLPGTSHRVEAKTIHLIEELFDGYALTLVEPGPKELDWGHFAFREDGIWFHEGPEQDQALFRCIIPRLRQAA